MRIVKEAGGISRVDMNDLERIAHFTADPLLYPFAQKYLSGEMNENDFAQFVALRNTIRTQARVEAAAIRIIYTVVVFSVGFSLGLIF